MADNTKSCVAFLAVIATACLLAWLGGYDFNRRGDDVLVVSVFTLMIAVFAAVFVRDDLAV